MRTLEIRLALAGAVSAAMLAPTGCGWVDKTVECHALTEVSHGWGQKADGFGRELEAEMTRQLQSLETLDMGSRADLVRASSALEGASDTLDGEADGFFEDLSGDFEALELSDPQLVTYRSHYLARVDDVGTRIHEMTSVIRQLSEIFARLDPRWLSSQSYARKLEQQMTDIEQRIDSAERRLNESMHAEQVLIDQINAYCAPTVPPRRVASL